MSTKFKIILLFILIICGSAYLFFKKDQTALLAEKVNNSLGITARVFNSKPSDMVFVELKFKNAGGFLNPKEKRGISVLLAELLFKRAEGKTEAETIERMRELQIGNIRAFAAFDHFYISFSVTKDTVDEALKFVADSIFSFSVKSGELEEVKGLFPTVQNIDFAFPSDIAFKKLLYLLYGQSPYGLDFTGTSIAIKGISVADVKDFLRENFTKQNVEVLFVGNVSRFDIERYLTILFHNAPGEYKKQKFELSEVSSGQEKVYIEKSNMEDIAYVCFGFRLDGLNDRAKAALLVIEKALFDDPYADFSSGIRELGIANDISSSLYMFEHSSFLMVGVLIDVNDLENYKNYLRKKIRDYKHIDVKLLSKAQAYFIENATRGLVSLENVSMELTLKSLPFEKLNEKDYKSLSSKLFVTPKIVVIKK